MRVNVTHSFFVQISHLLPSTSQLCLSISFSSFFLALFIPHSKCSTHISFVSSHLISYSVHVSFSFTIVFLRPCIPCAALIDLFLIGQIHQELNSSNTAVVDDADADAAVSDLHMYNVYVEKFTVLLVFCNLFYNNCAAQSALLHNLDRINNICLKSLFTFAYSVCCGRLKVSHISQRDYFSCAFI